ncbi:unnamed protein product [Prorocentrum cordatum]|uniref:Uncharacterized protein n=1 Tax=Prorocentrum cordatum TaxID=2364126 RepID=A0ABN9TNS4_9DINO|nr:unnamed protein product [Polarella glacialis]
MAVASDSSGIGACEKGGLWPEALSSVGAPGEGPLETEVTSDTAGLGARKKGGDRPPCECSARRSARGARRGQRRGPCRGISGERATRPRRGPAWPASPGGLVGRARCDPAFCSRDVE